MVDNHVVFIFFFFQAEDGIRDLTETGVQTCALPIWVSSCSPRREMAAIRMAPGRQRVGPASAIRAPIITVTVGGVDWLERPAALVCAAAPVAGSGERRVGKEWRSRGAPDH